MQENSRKAKTHGISLSPILSEKLENSVKEMGMSKSSIVAMALNDFFRKGDAEKK